MIIDVLEKMDHLMSVSKVMGKKIAVASVEHRKSGRHLRTRTQDISNNPTANFESNGNATAQRVRVSLLC